MAVKVSSGTLLFVSGQVAVDKDGQLVGKGDIYAQMRQVYQNIQNIITAAGGTMENIVKVTSYVTDRAYFPALREIRREFFREPYPASTAVIVKGLAHEDWLVEIEAVVVLP
jgi:reactive intermediate/imine deaminase